MTAAMLFAILLLAAEGAGAPAPTRSTPPADAAVAAWKAARAHRLADLGIKDSSEPAPPAHQDTSPELREPIHETRLTAVELQFGWSAKICDRQSERTEAIAAIKKERRYAKLGGVVHLGRLGDLQDEVANADEDIAEYRSELRATGKPALSCKYVAAHREQ